MPLVFASFVNGQFLLGIGAARPCVDKPDETIDGFPEFAVTVDTLKDPEAKKKLKALAKRIVASHQTPTRIIGLEVHGHADVTLRIPAGQERDKTEFEVSRDRAEGAQQLLLSMIEDEGGKPIIAGIRANSKALGVGSKCRKVIPAQTDAEMKQNRRVEIFLKEFRTLPAPPTPPPPPKPPVPFQHWRIQVKSGKITTASVPFTDILGGANISLDVVIVDLDRKVQAKFVAKSQGFTIGGNVGVSPLPAGTVIFSVGEGDPVPFTTHDAVAGIGLQSFDGDLTMAQNPGASVSVKTVPAPKGFRGEFAMIFDALRVGTQPKPVFVEGGNDPFIIQGSLGIAPGNGSLKMQGQPFPLK